jgi:hypothetical protein
MVLSTEKFLLLSFHHLLPTLRMILEKTASENREVSPLFPYFRSYNLYNFPYVDNTPRTGETLPTASQIYHSLTSSIGQGSDIVLTDEQEK